VADQCIDQLKGHAGGAESPDHYRGTISNVSNRLFYRRYTLINHEYVT
jgi:hypothetical protein